MGKKALFAAALAAGAAAVVSNAVLNDTLRRRPPHRFSKGRVRAVIEPQLVYPRHSNHKAEIRHVPLRGGPA